MNFLFASIIHGNSASPFARRVLAVLCLSFGPLVFAGDIVIKSADADIVNEMFVVNANVEFQFSDDALEAIRSGVALFIDVDFRIKRKRRLIWDPNVLHLSRRYQIERHALSDRYIITDLVTEDRRIYESLESAIDDLGRIAEVPIAERSDFDAEHTYRIAVRARLDLESLPAPLRPIAYISPSWRMSSGWHQWTLNH